MAAKDTDEGKPEAEEADVSLDMSQAAVKKMIADARERGYITYEQLNQVMPPEQVSSEQIEDVMSMLSEMGINVIEDEDVEEGEAVVGGELVETGSGARDIAVVSTTTETLDRTDDPVRMYLREMGSVELLSREGEIAIAKRIEAGRNTMIAGLCESPLTFQAIIIWRDELLSEDILLRDVIDLEATFGRSLDGEEGLVGADLEGVDVEAAPRRAGGDEPELDADGPRAAGPHRRRSVHLARRPRSGAPVRRRSGRPGRGLARRRRHDEPVDLREGDRLRRRGRARRLRRGRGHVGHHAQGRVAHGAQALGDGAAQRGVELGHHHGGALGRKAQGHGLADATARAGDDANLVVQSHDLTAPAVRPWMKKRCRNAKPITTGSELTMEAAMAPPQSLLLSPM